MTVSRRQFLKASGAVVLGFSGLHSLLNKTAFSKAKVRFQEGFGPLVPDPNRILDLPEGFSYHIFSRTGDAMDDGLIVPGDHDGMAAFVGANGRTILIRNHELSMNELSKSPFGSNNQLINLIDQNLLYDAGSGVTPWIGGTTTLIYNTETRQLEKHFLSMAGTIRNCAGGPTPWNSWITCEETVQRAGGSVEKDHGFNFEVPVSEEIGLSAAVPLKAMGRFNHEAVAVDPASGIVFQTEDRDDGLIYRYIPDERENLATGGRLQALMVKDMASLDTRNWNAQNVTAGEVLDVTWVDLSDVESPSDDLRRQGFGNGAARFARGEGMWYGLKAVFFACTNGGPDRTGQIWRYHPSPVEGTPEEEGQPGKLELFLEPNDSSLLEKADNVTVAPWGDLIICEDGSGTQFLVGVTPQGGIYKLGRNSLNTSEFAGATFSPDGTTLFVNIQSPGMTLAITGPWTNPTGVGSRLAPGNAIMMSSLFQNHPNPFNAQTKIAFRLGDSSNVTLDIYNITGQLIRRLDLGRRNEGEHSATWDGRDSSQHIAPTGVYLVQMRAGDFTALRRLTLIK